MSEEQAGQTGTEKKGRKPRTPSNYLVLRASGEGQADFTVLARATTVKKAWAAVEQTKEAGEMIVVCIRGKKVGGSHYQLK